MAGQLPEKQIETITGPKTTMPDHIVEPDQMVDRPESAVEELSRERSARLFETPLTTNEAHACQCQKPAAKDLAGLAAKLLKVMKACAVVPKDEKNAAQHYKYVSSDAVLKRVNGALCEAGLATVCGLEVIDRQPRTTNTGGMWELVTVRARLTIIDSETGASIQSEGIGQGYDGGDKALSKAQTQARKYAWLLALNTSTGDDPEADLKTDQALEPTIACKKCGGASALTGTGDDNLAGAYKEYTCSKCGTFRVKA